MSKKKHRIPENLSSSQLLDQQSKQINQNWSRQQQWTNLHNRGFIFRANKSINLPYTNKSLIEKIDVRVSLKFNKIENNTSMPNVNRSLDIYFSNLNVDDIPNPTLFLYLNKVYHFHLEDPRISLLFSKEDEEGELYNLKNIKNNPLNSIKKSLVFKPHEILKGCYIITTSLFSNLSPKKKIQTLTVSAGNKMFVLNKNYSQNFRLLISPGYNLFFNDEIDSFKLNKVMQKYQTVIKSELSTPNYYYLDVRNRLWISLYDQNNRLNLLKILYNLSFISDVRPSEIFPDYNYLFNKTDEGTDNNLDSIEKEVATLSLDQQIFLRKFILKKIGVSINISQNSTTSSGGGGGGGGGGGAGGY